ncbi:MAG: NADP-dependent oxidoreductase [Alphaproteobacteria bacterium]
MKAVYYERFGESEVLQLGDLPMPKPGPGEVLVNVAAASVNPIDWKLREGFFDGVFPHEFPVIPGWDLAGRVAALGEGATGFSPGDRVYAYCRKPVVRAGTYAEYVVVDADVLAPSPANLSDVEAATIPLVGLTVWQSLFEFAGLKAGQSVLVHAGAGGVGSLAVQLAAHAGARVFATASAANADYLLELGASRAIDYKIENLSVVQRFEVPAGFDVVFDTVGGDVLAASYGLLKPGGALPALNDEPDSQICEAKSIRGLRLFSEPNGAHLRRLTALIDEGALKPSEIEVFPLKQAAEAMDLSQAGHVRGKLVLDIGAS